MTISPEYTKLLERLVKGAEYIENPLIKPEDKEKAMLLYNEIERQILNMRGV